MTKRSEEIKLKLKKAKAFLDEVDVLVKNRLYNTAINRLYYSCFHATTALLLTKNFAPKTHSGAGALLYTEFVQKGLFDSQHASLFAKLMNERQESDYGDYLIIDEEDLNEFLEPAKQYVTYVTKLVNEHLAE